MPAVGAAGPTTRQVGNGSMVDRRWEELEPHLLNYPVTAILRSLGFYAVTRDAELNG